MRQVKSGGTPSVGSGDGGGSGGVGIPGTGAGSEVHNTPVDPDRVSAVGVDGFVANHGTVTSPNSAAFNSGWARENTPFGAASSFAANGGRSGGYQTFAVNAGTADGDSSAAFGSAFSLGAFSFAAGRENKAHFEQFIIGEFAVDDTIPDDVLTPGQFLFKIGGGADDINRKDVFTVDTYGTARPTSVVTPYVRSGKANRNAAYKIHGGAKNSSSLDIVNPAYSISEQHVALSTYWQYRVFVMNHDTVTKTLGIAKVAGSPTDMNAGNTLSWQTQQLAGVDTLNNTVPAGTFVSPSDLDVDDISPAILALDPVLAAPVARTDGGTAPDLGAYPLVLSRTLWVNGVRPLSALDPDWRARTGLLFKAYGSSYDFVTGNNAAAPTNAYLYQTTFVEFSYEKPTLSGLTLGDSTNTGVGTTSARFAPIDEACRLAKVAATNRILVPMKMASSGRRSVGNIGTLNAVIAAGLRPDFALIPSWTVNDGSSPAQFYTSWMNAMRCIDICERNGIVPILLTPPPYNSIGVNLASWLAARSAALAMKTQMLVCDMVKNICNVGTGAYLPGMSGDGTHFNDTSTPLAGAELFSTVRQLL